MQLILFAVFGTRRSSGRLLLLVGTTLFVNCALAVPAACQTNSGDLPSNCAAYKSVPLPAEAQGISAPKAPPDCASYRSYRGISRPVNYSQARMCAWRERLAQKAGLGQNEAEPDAWVVGGSLILADIYFNGEGVKRNVPLALRFACEAEEGMAMLALPDIRKIESSPQPHRRFEFCDYAATTFSMDFCSDYASELADARRNRYYESLKSSMTPNQQKAFKQLMAVKDAYIQTHAAEVDQGGTIRAVRTIGSEEILEDLFRTEVVHFERGKWPMLSEHQIATAETLLQAEYKKDLREFGAQSKQSIDEGAVSADHLASVEKSWEAYRNAWVAFAQVRYPTKLAVIRAEITLDRYRLLKTFQPYPQ